MKRFFLAAALVLLGASTGSADYILIKINLNELTFLADTIHLPGLGQPQPGGGPPQPGPGGAKMPRKGGGGVRPPGPGVPNGPNGMPEMPPEDPNPRWVYAFVETKSKPTVHVSALADNAPMTIYHFDHRWGLKNWYPMPGGNSQLPQVVGVKKYAGALNDFTKSLAKERQEKVKNVESILILARRALQAGSMKQFHLAMKEAVDANPKHSAVQQYLRVKKELERPFNDDDPVQRDLLKDLAENKYHTKLSEHQHYALHHLAIALGDRHTEGLVKRRLAMLEHTLEEFYYWFAVQKENSLQPALPKYRLQVILANTPGEFMTRHLQWGSDPIVGDGFTPRRDNVIVMSAKSRLNDPLYQEFDTLLATKLVEINAKLQPFGVNIARDDLLSGKINESKNIRMGTVPIAYAQVAVLLSKTLEDQAEHLTASNEAVRQLLIAADIFPRNVQIPDWMVEGLAAFFETPPGLYPTVGAKNWTHLVSYKYLRNTKNRRLENPSAALFNVVTDRFFQEARLHSANLRQNPNSDEFRFAARDSWELARCTSWAFVYYLAQHGKLDTLFKYGTELNALPRDMDLSDMVVQGCFARAFGMTDNADPRRIDQAKLSSLAGAWSNAMQETNLDNIEIQDFLLKMRATQEYAGEVSTNPDDDPEPPPPGTNPPGNPSAIPPNPTQPGGLAGSTWSGSETLQGFSKVTFRFQNGGSATMLGKGGNTAGTWKLMDNNVTLQFGPANYTGTLTGNTIQGTATNGMATWNFTASRGNGQPAMRQPAMRQPNMQPKMRPLMPKKR